MSLKNGVGDWLEGSWLDHHVVDYFHNIFKSRFEKASMSFLTDIDQRVTRSMSEDLSQDFTADEVRVTLKQMHPTKTSRLDGMPPLFYQ